MRSKQAKIRTDDPDRILKEMRVADKLRRALPRAEAIYVEGPRRKYPVEVTAKSVIVEKFFGRPSKFRTMEDAYLALQRVIKVPFWVAGGYASPTEVEDPYEEILDYDSPEGKETQVAIQSLLDAASELREWEPQRAASTREALVKLGSQDPSLRPHIRPVLAELDKTANWWINIIVEEMPRFTRVWVVGTEPRGGWSSMDNVYKRAKGPIQKKFKEVMDFLEPMGSYVHRSDLLRLGGPFNSKNIYVGYQGEMGADTDEVLSALKAQYGSDVRTKFI